MLQPVRHILDEVKIILASSSPRRSEILHSLGLKFDVIPSKYEENLNPKDFSDYGDFVMKTAYNKVIEVAERVPDNNSLSTVIIGSDTVVSFNGKIYGKPKDKGEAFTFLNELSGKVHTVYTGVVIKSPFEVTQFYTSTDVKMAHLEKDVIEAYIETKEPLDKAGAYGIQGIGGSLIEKVNGDYFTVMGLPVHETCKHLVEVCKRLKQQNELN
ncbi:dTTP/UTP pyrophosphatase [Lycorma delicatula]|uniref:dTTP/UTP pyrophosphatase n=1 Tax=Lycorma delicatula TaxID=130591 RepID=UPI003F5136EF